jgi:hypothetical protein
VRNWPRLLSQCKRYALEYPSVLTELIEASCLKPGGTVELVDMDLNYTSDDGSVTEANSLKLFVEDITEAASSVGISLKIADKFFDLLEEAGFVNIEKEVFELPMGPWSKDKRLKEVGLFHREQFLQGLHGIALGLLGRVSGWSHDEIQVCIAIIRKDIQNAAIHGYWYK